MSRGIAHGLDAWRGCRLRRLNVPRRVGYDAEEATARISAHAEQNILVVAMLRNERS